MPEKLEINPWLKMWTKPKETIRALVTFDPRYRFLTLCAIYGIPSMLQLAQSMSLGYSYSLVGILIGSIFLSIFAGMIGITISSALLYMTGKWIGGVGSYLQIRCAVSWSNVTNIASILLWASLIASFKIGYFTDAFATAPLTQGQSWLFTGTFFIQAVVSIWSFVLLVQSLSEVQGFSVWKALLNVFISFGIVVVFFWMLGLLIVVG
jgi:hypothetical protein